MDVAAFVDTNILIRHLTGEPPEMARRASGFLASAERLILTDLIVAETVYVLESVYEVTREEVARSVGSLLALESLVCVDAGIISRALEIYETFRIDFPEAYLSACAKMTGGGVVASFDRSIDRVPGIVRLEPS